MPIFKGAGVAIVTPMKENLEVVCGLLGGLALFLYGMNIMADGMQKSAGSKMKQKTEN